MNHLTRRNVMIGAGAALVASALPALPAIAAPAVVEETKRKVFFMPSIHWITMQTKILDYDINNQTIVYHVMERWENVEGQKYPSIEQRLVTSDRYKEWLVENPPEDGIPYHIENGRVITAIPGGRDPVISEAVWSKRTRERLAAGFFDRDWTDISIMYPETGLIG